jgi:hypothetical protein
MLYHMSRDTNSEWSVQYQNTIRKNTSLMLTCPIFFIALVKSLACILVNDSWLSTEALRISLAVSASNITILPLSVF